MKAVISGCAVMWMVSVYAAVLMVSHNLCALMVNTDLPTRLYLFRNRPAVQKYMFISQNTVIDPEQL